MPAPTPYVEDPDDEFDYEADFKVMVAGDAEPGGGLSITHTAQEAALVAEIPYRKQRSAARKLFGYSWCDEEAPYKLYREPPAAYPTWPTLRCCGVTFTGRGLKSNPENENGEPNFESPFAGPNGEVLKVASYEWAVATVKYRSFGMTRFLPDDEIEDYRDEFKRYFTIEAGAAVETLSADNTLQLTFAEGPAADPKDQPFPAPLAQLLSKVSLTWRWYMVPHNYISDDPLVLNPRKIIDRLGTWNSDMVLGYEKGELLLLALEAEPVTFPVVPADPYDLPLMGWNLSLHYSLYRPEKGVADEPPGTSPYHGHRIFVWRKNGKSYWAKRTDSTNELLPGKDHWPIFSHVDDPSAP